MPIENKILIMLRRGGHLAARAVSRIFFWPNPQVVVLCYHSLTLDDWRYGVSMEVFKRQIEYMLENFQPMSLEELSRRMRGQTSISGPSFAVTFDDGYADIMESVSFLAKKGIRPAVFALADPEKADQRELGTTRRLLRAQELIDLSRAGWEIGCHSLSHGDFSCLDAESRVWEIKGAKAKLEKDLGLSIRYFAYPRGRYDQNIINLAEQSGYELGFTADDTPFKDGMNRFLIPRVGVDQTHSFEEFQALMNYPAIYFRNLIRRIT